MLIFYLQESTDIFFSKSVLNKILLFSYQIIKMKAKIEHRMSIEWAKKKDKSVQGFHLSIKHVCFPLLNYRRELCRVTRFKYSYIVILTPFFQISFKFWFVMHRLTLSRRSLNDKDNFPHYISSNHFIKCDNTRIHVPPFRKGFINIFKG